MALSSSALADVQEGSIKISPENPQPGEAVTVIGQADAGEVVDISISFEKVQAVSNGEYEYNLGKVTIPAGSKSFSLQAEGVNSLDISVSIFGVPIPVSDNLIAINGDVASFGTSKINSGTYAISLSGTSSGGEITFSFGANGAITADDNSHFEYTYTTENMPEGDFNLNMGGQSRQLTLGYTDSSASSSSSAAKSSSSSHTGTEFKMVPANTLGVDDEETDVGEITESDVSDVSDVSESLESITDSDYQEGYIMNNQTSSNNDLPLLGTVGAIIGIFCIGVIFLGYRKNRFK
ncbi:hypothetical protein [Methanolobus sp.]|uniref:hypothetical protein n=1 Tax=Methanolobus sp. TaxID=1874737 RepID=UPI0025D40486|nr:hypothetical protein [Methanolobus sp.]